jgi:hypothetical protein
MLSYGVVVCGCMEATRTDECRQQSRGSGTGRSTASTGARYFVSANIHVKDVSVNVICSRS